MVEFIIVVLIGIIIGSIGGYLFHKQKFGAENYVSNELYKSENKKTNDLHQTLQEKETTIGDLNTQIGQKEEAISNLEKTLEEERDRIKEQYDQLKEQFENLANDILEKKSEKFVELNKSKLDQILNPLGEKIEKFEKSVQDKYEKEIEGRASLEEQIKHLTDLNQQISEDAVNLTKALKGDSKTRGDWGELQLEVLLENSGLTKDVHFQMRSTFKDEDGKKTQPDCIIILPDGKNYVIDSKVSLVAYENYVSSEDDAEKEIFLKDHIESIKTHIKELSAKDYSSIHSINPPDYVFMFVPIEPAWFTALGANSDLYTIALEKNIVLVSVTTLLATMRTISFIWQQENQKKNVLEIARQSGALYDKFCNFVSDLEGVGKSMSQSKDKYDEAIKKLSTGKGNLISRSERIKELGAKTKKSLPKELLEKTEMGLLDENTE